jgi:hypothetical protein
MAKLEMKDFTWRKQQLGFFSVPKTEEAGGGNDFQGRRQQDGGGGDGSFGRRNFGSGAKEGPPKLIPCKLYEEKHTQQLGLKWFVLLFP